MAASSSARRAIIMLTGGIPAAYDIARCGHQFKVPRWAQGEWSRAKCDHCSTHAEREVWDARMDSLVIRSSFDSVPTETEVCDLSGLDPAPEEPGQPCPCCPNQPRQRSAYCSPRCQRLSQFAPQVCALPGCVETFRSGNTQRRCCSARHNRRLYRIEHPQHYEPQPIELRRERWQKRRALKKGASTGHPVRLGEIAERDAWTCQLCQVAVDPKSPWPHPLSKSLDHIIALSRGGAHDPSNVQLAHLKCNIAKGST